MHKSLVYIDQLLKRIFHFILNYSWATIFLIILTFSFFAYQTKKLTQSVSIEDQLDPDMQSSKDLSTLKTLFSSNMSMGLIVLPAKNGFFSNSELCKLQEKINNTIYSNSIVSDFISPFKLRFLYEQ